jgi:hypothetical protein
MGGPAAGREQRRAAKDGRKFVEYCSFTQHYTTGVLLYHLLAPNLRPDFGHVYLSKLSA